MSTASTHKPTRRSVPPHQGKGSGSTKARMSGTSTAYRYNGDTTGSHNRHSQRYCPSSDNGAIAVTAAAAAAVVVVGTTINSEGDVSQSLAGSGDDQDSGGSGSNSGNHKRRSTSRIRTDGAIASARKRGLSIEGHSSGRGESLTPQATTKKIRNSANTNHQGNKGDGYTKGKGEGGGGVDGGRNPHMVSSTRSSSSSFSFSSPPSLQSTQVRGGTKRRIMRAARGSSGDHVENTDEGTQMSSGSSSWGSRSCSFLSSSSLSSSSSMRSSLASSAVFSSSSSYDYGDGDEEEGSSTFTYSSEDSFASTCLCSRCSSSVFSASTGGGAAGASPGSLLPKHHPFFLTQRLPYELFLHIASYLNDTDCCTLLEVSRDLHGAITSADLVTWRDVCLREWRYKQGFQNFVLRFSELQRTTHSDEVEIISLQQRMIAKEHASAQEASDVCATCDEATEVARRRLNRQWQNWEMRRVQQQQQQQQSPNRSKATANTVNNNGNNNNNSSRNLPLPMRGRVEEHSEDTDNEEEEDDDDNDDGDNDGDDEESHGMYESNEDFVQSEEEVEENDDSNAGDEEEDRSHKKVYSSYPHRAKKEGEVVGTAALFSLSQTLHTYTAHHVTDSGFTTATIGTKRASVSAAAVATTAAVDVSSATSHPSVNQNSFAASSFAERTSFTSSNRQAQNLKQKQQGKRKNEKSCRRADGGQRAQQQQRRHQYSNESYHDGCSQNSNSDSSNDNDADDECDVTPGVIRSSATRQVGRRRRGRRRRGHSRRKRSRRPKQRKHTNKRKHHSHRHRSRSGGGGGRKNKSKSKKRGTSSNSGSHHHHHHRHHSVGGGTRKVSKSARRRRRHQRARQQRMRELAAQERIQQEQQDFMAGFDGMSGLAVGRGAVLGPTPTYKAIKSATPVLSAQHLDPSLALVPPLSLSSRSRVSAMASLSSLPPPATTTVGTVSRAVGGRAGGSGGGTSSALPATATTSALNKASTVSSSPSLMAATQSLSATASSPVSHAAVSTLQNQQQQQQLYWWQLTPEERHRQLRSLQRRAAEQQQQEQERREEDEREAAWREIEAEDMQWTSSASADSEGDDDEEDNDFDDDDDEGEREWEDASSRNEDEEDEDDDNNVAEVDDSTVADSPLFKSSVNSPLATTAIAAAATTSVDDNNTYDCISHQHRHHHHHSSHNASTTLTKQQVASPTGRKRVQFAETATRGGHDTEKHGMPAPIFSSFLSASSLLENSSRVLGEHSGAALGQETHRDVTSTSVTTTTTQEGSGRLLCSDARYAPVQREKENACSHDRDDNDDVSGTSNENTSDDAASLPHTSRSVQSSILVTMNSSSAFSEDRYFRSQGHKRRRLKRKKKKSKVERTGDVSSNSNGDSGDGVKNQNKHSNSQKKGGYGSGQGFALTISNTARSSGSGVDKMVFAEDSATSHTRLSASGGRGRRQQKRKHQGGGAYRRHRRKNSSSSDGSARDRARAMKKGSAHGRRGRQRKLDNPYRELEEEMLITRSKCMLIHAMSRYAVQVPLHLPGASHHSHHPHGTVAATEEEGHTSSTQRLTNESGGVTAGSNTSYVISSSSAITPAAAASAIDNTESPRGGGHSAGNASFVIQVQPTAVPRLATTDGLSTSYLSSPMLATEAGTTTPSFSSPTAAGATTTTTTTIRWNTHLPAPSSSLLPAVPILTTRTVVPASAAPEFSSPLLASTAASTATPSSVVAVTQQQQQQQQHPPVSAFANSVSAHVVSAVSGNIAAAGSSQSRLSSHPSPPPPHPTNTNTGFYPNYLSEGEYGAASAALLSSFASAATADVRVGNGFQNPRTHLQQQQHAPRRDEASTGASDLARPASSTSPPSHGSLQSQRDDDDDGSSSSSTHNATASHRDPDRQPHGSHSVVATSAIDRIASTHQNDGHDDVDDVKGEDEDEEDDYITAVSWKFAYYMSRREARRVHITVQDLLRGTWLACFKATGQVHMAKFMPNQTLIVSIAAIPFFSENNGGGGNNNTAATTTGRVASATGAAAPTSMPPLPFHVMQGGAQLNVANFPPLKVVRRARVAATDAGIQGSNSSAAALTPSPSAVEAAATTSPSSSSSSVSVSREVAARAAFTAEPQRTLKLARRVSDWIMRRSSGRPAPSMQDVLDVLLQVPKRGRGDAERENVLERVLRESEEGREIDVNDDWGWTISNGFVKLFSLNVQSPLYVERLQRIAQM